MREQEQLETTVRAQSKRGRTCTLHCCNTYLYLYVYTEAADDFDKDFDDFDDFDKDKVHIRYHSTNFMCNKKVSTKKNLSIIL